MLFESNGSFLSFRHSMTEKYFRRSKGRALQKMLFSSGKSAKKMIFRLLKGTTVSLRVSSKILAALSLLIISSSCFDCNTQREVRFGASSSQPKLVASSTASTSTCSDWGARCARLPIGRSSSRRRLAHDLRQARSHAHGRTFTSAPPFGGAARSSTAEPCEFRRCAPTITHCRARLRK